MVRFSTLLPTRATWMFVAILALVCAACGDSPRDEADASDDAGRADGSARDALPRSDADIIGELFDASDDAALCDEGSACVTSDGCLRGTTRCDGDEALCIASSDAYVERGTECGDGGGCDGAGLCTPCGGEGQPCCGSECDDALMCDDASGSCSACAPDAACRLADPCRIGVQSCDDDEPVCNDDGPAERGRSCGDVCSDEGLCACTTDGDCVECGGPGEPCCGTVCDSGATCNPDTNICFTCDAGSECALADPCRLGVESCTTGAPVCLEVADQPRGVSCGEGTACDGDASCVSCGGAGQPCCGSECGAGLACHPTTRSCFACADGAACLSENECRTGTVDCTAGEARCEEDASVTRSMRCGADGACDGAGGCEACGGMDEPCCGAMCDSALACDADTHSCVTCVSDASCTSSDGCRTGTRDCTGGASRCETTANAARMTPCGGALACDGSGECTSCGGSGEPCCDGACGEDLACNTATGTCGSCPEGMILVPGTSFLMGAPTSDAAAEADERPEHRVAVPAFCLDEDETSVAAYLACASCTTAGSGAGCNASDGTRSSHPINCVTFAQAQAFCASRGARLPSEAEWEAAARSAAGRRYPWGNAAPTCALANHAECTGATDALGAHPTGETASGIADLSGNVSEWVSDFYAADFYGEDLALGDSPTGPSTGTTRVIRGGGHDDDANELRSTARRGALPTTQSASLGLRCAQSLP